MAMCRTTERAVIYESVEYPGVVVLDEDLFNREPVAMVGLANVECWCPVADNCSCLPSWRPVAIVDLGDGRLRFNNVSYCGYTVGDAWLTPANVLSGLGPDVMTVIYLVGDREYWRARVDSTIYV